ncbi:DUF309 domain-containing protein [Ruegeria lacuscaerulensis]|uniref:DUF309 domain-containing protein n=1 Tax=Ruegeria lacuscaerulensis TaxID=55218 RepID=UPI00147D15E6|nr:DUF309 domain-containing protein [Ruegeria lacuscaerulensis]
MTSDCWPPHAYVPGQTARHPEGLFDPLKTGLSDVAPSDLQNTSAWTSGLAFLSEGYFWEAHEVLEAVWLACPPNSPERLMVQAVIQYANACLKGRMGQPRAMARLMTLSDDLAREAMDRAGGAVLGLHGEKCNIIHKIVELGDEDGKKCI